MVLITVVRPYVLRSFCTASDCRFGATLTWPPTSLCAHILVDLRSINITIQMKINADCVAAATAAACTTRQNEILLRLFDIFWIQMLIRFRILWFIRFQIRLNSKQRNIFILWAFLFSFWTKGWTHAIQIFISLLTTATRASSSGWSHRGF